MRRVLGVCVLLAGCGNPLADMDRLSDVEAVEPALDAVQTSPEAKPAQNRSLFSGFFTRQQSAPAGTQTSTAPSEPAALKRARPSRTALNLPDVAQGTSVPYGDIARVCGVPKAAMGKQVERMAGYKVFDTNPQSTAPRTFYVTGFSDGCARQFTAALVLIGTPSRHEELRYGQPSDLYPYSQIDRAYEKVKSRVCGVPRGRPCGAAIRKMERDTIFLSTYERFSNNARWADILIHNGTVLAKDIKS